MHEIKVMDKQSWKILIWLIRFDKKNGGTVFGNWRARRDFKKHIIPGKILPEEYCFDLFDLIGHYKHCLSKEDAEIIEYLFAQSLNNLVN